MEDQSMRIVFLANSASGLYEFRRELIGRLCETHDVYIAVPCGENRKYIEKLKNVGCKFIDVPMARRSLNPLTDLKLLRKIFSILSDVNPFLVITYTIKPNIYGGLACRVKKIPYAANITGLGSAFEKKGLLRKIVTIMYKVALKKSRVVFFMNSANKMLFVNEKIVPEGNTCVLDGSGVNLDYFSVIPYPNNNVCKFLFVGRVMKEKGIDELFEAMKRLVREGEKCFLDVVGRFEDNYEKQTSLYESEGWLKFHGYQEDVRPFIKACDCFVLPSYHEGMANTNLECAACGRPIITSNIPGCKEAVVEGSGCLCEPKNADSLYEAMKTMIRLPRNQREQMGQTGRKHMEEVFDKKKVVKETEIRLFGCVKRERESSL